MIRSSRLLSRYNQCLLRSGPMLLISYGYSYNQQYDSTPWYCTFGPFPFFFVSPNFTAPTTLMYRESQQAVAYTSLVTILFVVISDTLLVFVNGPKTILFFAALFLVRKSIQNDCEPSLYCNNTTPFKLPPLTTFYDTILQPS